jgi:hypothetical protein
MDREAELSRWISGRRAAEAREREERRDRTISPGEAFRQAMSLVSLAARRHGWPPPADEREAAEDLAFHLVWARLRERATGS